jgi:DNA-binding response OmpR family regulator
MNEISLQGRSVLVVDDDFYLATDIAAALEDAHAVIIGPFGRSADALASLQDDKPDLAVVDLNLGSGPNFDLVRALVSAGIPTLIITGYDQDILPPDLTHLRCLQKPIHNRQLLSSIRLLLA